MYIKISLKYLILSFVFMNIIFVCRSEIIHGKNIRVKWRDGDYVWYEATYHYNLKNKSRIKDVLVKCPMIKDPYQKRPRFSINYCVYSMSYKHQWVNKLSLKIKKLITNNDKRIPEKRLGDFEMVRSIEKIKEKYNKHCPFKEYNIFFGRHGGNKKDKKGRYRSYGYVKEYSPFDVSCRSKRKITCPDGYDIYYRAKSYSDRFFFGPEVGCVKLHEPKTPLFQSSNQQMALGCPARGCIDYDRVSHDTHMKAFKHKGKVVWSDPIIQNHEFKKYYCQVNLKTPRTRQSCESYMSYLERSKQNNIKGR